MIRELFYGAILLELETIFGVLVILKIFMLAVVVLIFDEYPYRNTRVH